MNSGHVDHQLPFGHSLTYQGTPSGWERKQIKIEHKEV